MISPEGVETERGDKRYLDGKEIEIERPEGNSAVIKAIRTRTQEGGAHYFQAP